MAKPIVAILVVVHNRLDLTIKCLAHITAASSAASVMTVIVDDGSTDGTREWLKDNLPTANIVQGDGSLWFGGGLQKGIDYIKTEMPQVDYVLSLNNDVFMQPGCIDALVAESDSVAIVSAILTDSKMAIIYSFGTVWHWYKGWICPLTGDSVSEHPEFMRGFSMKVGMLTTACTLIPMKWLRVFGSIDVLRYPQHRADTDLFFKLAKVGAPLWVTSRAIAASNDGLETNRYRALDHSFFDFIRDSLFNKLCPLHFPSMVRSYWGSCPSRLWAIPVIMRIVFLYLRTIFSLLIYRFLRSFGIYCRNRESS